MRLCLCRAYVPACIDIIDTHTIVLTYEGVTVPRPAPTSGLPDSTLVLHQTHPKPDSFGWDHALFPSTLAGIIHYLSTILDKLSVASGLMGKSLTGVI